MVNHCGTVELKTERLVLRRFNENDAEQMYAGWMNDERVAKYTSWYAHSSIEMTKSFINYVLGLDERTSYNWVIEYNEKLIGTINVCYSDDLLEIAGIAYALAFDSWGKGYITEAAKAVVSFLFDEVGYRKIIAGCDAENVGSMKVMEKLGMKQEACFRQQIIRKDGTFGDDLQYGLFRNEFVI
jgi:ribosomal-protein-alanine N-acetyltransferase